MEWANNINFGSYTPPEAERLKEELLKNGIPTQLVYPGTNIGKEASGGAQLTAWTILIPYKDRQAALRIKKVYISVHYAEYFIRTLQE